MKKKILLPTDFSMNSWNAMNYARTLFKNEECEFYILNAFESKFYTTDSMMVPEPGEKNYEDAKAKSKENLEKELSRLILKEDNKKHIYYTISMYNSVLGAIRELVEQKDIEIIVLSNKGKSNASNTVFGSKTIDVMEKIRNCPVLVVPYNLIFKKPNEIVFPTNFKTPFKRRELNILYEFVRITNSKLRILHINQKKSLSESQLNNKELLEDILEGLDYSFHWMEKIDIQIGLQNFVQTRGSEMITFINKKHAFFSSVFSYPMVKYLGHYSKIPVLVMHDLRN
ncbi:universal stress protein [Christiangramia sediminis]|uniref:Universal stress protein n=1 Tax=Christiangramia sediminis TaxID=2881336 RepID=A0A9X1LIJ5_9FLAO|nr:universal stress protein [Christiangramia sediminis]MCB7481030.1 universal stress protein [Christiangramia sediminis]